MYELLSDCGTLCTSCFLTVELYVRATFRMWNDMYELLSDCGTPCTSYFPTAELHVRVAF